MVTGSPLSFRVMVCHIDGHHVEENDSLDKDGGDWVKVFIDGGAYLDMPIVTKFEAGKSKTLKITKGRDQTGELGGVTK